MLYITPYKGILGYIPPSLMVSPKPGIENALFRHLLGSLIIGIPYIHHDYGISKNAHHHRNPILKV